MTASLRNESDWAYFQSELDRSDFIAIGRVSHEMTPNPKRRRRIVLSRAARGMDVRGDAIWWNPLELPFADLMAQLAPNGARVATPGGQAAFDVFLNIGYAGFHLSRATRVALSGGHGLFSICEHGVSAEAALADAGLAAGTTNEIDAQAGVTLTVWRPATQKN